jgi:cbb3-type cytochrome oxidase subunit 3
MKNSIIIAVITAMCTIGVVHFAYNTSDREKAFQSCLDDIQNKCSGVISYALALEAENAKLNRKLRQCRSGE